MNVDSLRQFLASLAAPLRESKAKQPADDLDALCTGLAPFAALSLGEFTDFLHTADTYRRTGVVAPPKPTRLRCGPKPIDQQKVNAAAQEYSQLFERAIDADLDYSTIERELKRIEKTVTKDEALALAKEVDVTPARSTRKAAFEELQHRIFQRKQSFERTTY